MKQKDKVFAELKSHHLFS